MSKKQLGIALLLTLLIAFLAIFLTYQYLNRNNGSLRLSIAPDQVTLKYGDSIKKVKYGQVISLEQGKYRFVFSRDGFKEVTKEIVVVKKSQQNIYIYLEPITADAKKIMNTGNNQLYKEEVVGHEINEGGKKLTENNPILKVLPILERNYTIEPCTIPKDYRGVGDDKEIAVCISALSDAAYTKAINDIRERGFNPDEYLVKRKG